MSDATVNEFQALRQSLNNIFGVGLAFNARVVGGIPASDETIKAWLQAKLGELRTDEEIAAEADMTFAEVYKSEEEARSTTFKTDAEGRLVLEGRCVKAMLKEAGQRLGLGKPVKGGRPSLKQDLHEALHVDEDMIPLRLADGTWAMAPTGYDERPIHVMGPKGPRTSIKRTAYVEGASIGWTCRILKCVHLKEANLKEILAFGQDLGLGADRSQGHGKFTVTDFEALS
jgi:hypothetical protein